MELLASLAPISLQHLCMPALTFIFGGSTFKRQPIHRLLRLFNHFFLRRSPHQFVGLPTNWLQQPHTNPNCALLTFPDFFRRRHV
jgi:hypothetical protein